MKSYLTFVLVAAVLVLLLTGLCAFGGEPRPMVTVPSLIQDWKDFGYLVTKDKSAEALSDWAQSKDLATKTHARCEQVRRMTYGQLVKVLVDDNQKEFHELAREYIKTK